MKVAYLIIFIWAAAYNKGGPSLVIKNTPNIGVCETLGKNIVELLTAHNRSYPIVDSYGQDYPLQYITTSYRCVEYTK